MRPFMLRDHLISHIVIPNATVHTDKSIILTMRQHMDAQIGRRVKYCLTNTTMPVTFRRFLN